jgi:hypothetical protein
MANKPAVLASVCSSFASQISLPVAGGGAGVAVTASAVRVTNITDIATGAMTVVPLTRRLGGAGTAGVRFTTTIDLGAAGTQATAIALQTALAAMPPTAPAFATVIAAVATAASIPAASLAAAMGPPAVVANAPFSIAVSTGGDSSSTSSSGSGSGAGGAAGGGIAGAILLAIGVWASRSYLKHGKLPCFRDRAAEKRSELERDAKTAALSSALEERIKMAERLSKELEEARRGNSNVSSGGTKTEFRTANPLQTRGKERTTFETSAV